MTRDEELRAPFHTTEPLKAAAKRLCIDPVRLRALWNEVFGEEAMAERGRRIRQASAADVGRASAGFERVFKETMLTCSSCGGSVSVKAIQVAQMDDPATFTCEQCSGDRDCPVCGQRVDGAKGLAAHFRHRREAGDAEHPAYEQGQEDALWVGKAEPEDYVTCRECRLRSSNLTGHVRVHGLTAEEYRQKHGVGARLRSIKEAEGIGSAIKEMFPDGRDYGTKEVQCPECDATWTAPKTLAMSVHDLRCLECKVSDARAEADAKWEGKSEPEDFVTCRVCGEYRATNLSSHLQSLHPEVVGSYLKAYPGALINSVQSGTRSGNCRIGLTPADLAPFMDKQGRVEAAKAAEALDCVYWTVLRYCRAYKIPVRNRLAFQKRVLDLVSEFLGGAPYIWEWSHTGIVNPKTGYRLFFDGFFATHNLIVEAHGKQHYDYIPYWHKTEVAFEERREVDALKVRRAQELGYRVLVVRYDEPFTDPAYLAGRLVGMGVLEPGDYRGESVGPAEGRDVFDLFG